MLKKLFLLILLLNLTTAICAAQTAVVSQSQVASDKTIALRQQSFDKVWTTVNEKHFDPTFGGVDWKKVREIYETKALAAKSDAEFHGLLQQMLDELGQSHFNVIPISTAALETNKNEFSGVGGIGVELKIIDEKAVVRRVKPDSAAAKVGLKTGFIVEKIGDKAVAEILADVDKSLATRRETAQYKSYVRERSLERRFAGKPATTIALAVLDEKNEPRVLSVAREIEKAEYSLPIGNFPPQVIDFEAKRLDKGVGYIRFNVWGMPQLAKIREALKTMTDAPGVIFDVRENPGGLGILAGGIAGNLVKEQISLGSFKFRTTEQKFIAYPQDGAYAGKVVVLTDNGSASTSELFAAGLQETKRARVVGETTMGAVLPSVIDTLPTGALFQYAIADYKSPGKILIEGRGVKPDLEVKLTRESLLAGNDSQIAAAIADILK